LGWRAELVAIFSSDAGCGKLLVDSNPGEVRTGLILLPRSDGRTDIGNPQVTEVLHPGGVAFS